MSKYSDADIDFLMASALAHSAIIRTIFSVLSEDQRDKLDKNLTRDRQAYVEDSSDDAVVKIANALIDLYLDDIRSF